MVAGLVTEQTKKREPLKPTNCINFFKHEAILCWYNDARKLKYMDGVIMMSYSRFAAFPVSPLLRHFKFISHFKPQPFIEETPQTDRPPSRFSSCHRSQGYSSTGEDKYLEVVDM